MPAYRAGSGQPRPGRSWGRTTPLQDARIGRNLGGLTLVDCEGAGSRLFLGMLCPSCGTENLAGRKFCTECGTALAVVCGSCGAPLVGGEKFCGECGDPVTGVEAGRTPAAVAREAPAAERRLVSVLFADLVGFTALSETRDAEEVRELLSRYFDTCRGLIELYGGTVEKFIGDAVMAVWGTPVATEDD